MAINLVEWVGLDSDEVDEAAGLMTTDLVAIMEDTEIIQTNMEMAADLDGETMIGVEILDTVAHVTDTAVEVDLMAAGKLCLFTSCLYTC